MGRVIAAAAYSAGRRVADIAVEESGAWAAKPGHFVWIGIEAPSERDLRQLQAQFGLHELAIEDALHAHQRPKLELYGDSLFLVLRTAQLQGDHVAFGETHIFAGQGFVISIRHGPSASYAPVRTRCESCPRLLRHGEDYVLYAILDFVVDNYVPVIEALESEVAELEDRVLKDRITRGDVERIYQLRRELLLLRRTVAPTIEVCRRLEHLELPFIDDAIRAYFRDVVDHVQRVNESIDALREVLAFSFEAALLLQSARQGDIQRPFAGWAAILAVPTAIAGIYGMNFDFNARAQCPLWLFRSAGCDPGDLPLSLLPVPQGGLGLAMRQRLQL
jgi:magnesium transporter